MTRDASAAKAAPKLTSLPRGIATLARLDTHTLLESPATDAPLRAAQEIHTSGARAKRPIVTFAAATLRDNNCAPSPQEVLRRLILQSARGTLVLIGIEDATPEITSAITSIIDMQKRTRRQAAETRLILTTRDSRKVPIELRSRTAYLFVK